jgi:hypothetical protein
MTEPVGPQLDVRRIGAILLIVLVACTTAVAGAADAATSPQSLRAAILRTASAKHSVRYVTVSSDDGARLRMVSDVARSEGIQRVTFSKNGRTGHATALVVRSTAYIRGDAFTLHAYMQFPRSFASRYAGKWISIPHASPLYRPVAIDVTFGSFISHALPQGHLSIVSRTIGGRKLKGLRGAAAEGPGILTLYVPTSGNPLPVVGKAVSSGAHPVRSTVSMSRWGEKLRLAAPAHATPLPGS